MPIPEKSAYLLMRDSADAVGYRPVAISTCRSRIRSLELKPKIRAITSPIPVSDLITASSNRKCSSH